jgi:aspartate aminotransferase
MQKHASLNLNIRGLSPSPTLAINELSKKLNANGRTVHSMGLGQSPFPVPVPVVEALKMHAHEKDYLPVKGLETLRQAVAHYHRNKDKVDIKPKNVLIGPGSKELMFILQLVYYGDIILPTPCWVSYAPQAKIVGRNIKLIPTTFEDKWLISHNQLDAFLESEKDPDKPRLLVLNYPSNPVGVTYSPEGLKKLARVAKKHNMIILSDEIYGPLHFKGNHVSIAQYYPEGTIISSGLSKWCGAGGWRLGTFAFPKNFDWLIDNMAVVASETYTSVSAPIQYAAVRAFRGGILIERYLQHVRRILEHLGNRCTDLLQQAGIRVHAPEGAFYLFPDFSPLSDKMKEKGITHGHQLCERLLQETGVAMLPGEAFQCPPGTLTARLAYVNFDGAAALTRSETIPLNENLPADFADSYCSSTIQAVTRIADWVS